MFDITPPFDRLRALYNTIEPNDSYDPIIASIGEPQIPPPTWINESLQNIALKDWAHYPRVRPSDEFEYCVRTWLNKRYHLNPSWCNAHVGLLPAVGSKEILFSFIGTIIRDKMQQSPMVKPLMLIANPYYHVYEAAVKFHGGDIFPLGIDDDISDLSFLNAQQQESLCGILICSPDNPSGRFWSENKICQLITHAHHYDVPLITDECYSEIWLSQPPKGILDICCNNNLTLKNIFTVNSLSKRSSAAGLRVGYIAGDKEKLSEFAFFRGFGAPVIPFALQKIAIRLWNDETHVVKNRQHYQKNITIAEKYLASYPEFKKPEGGFFLWLKVNDDIKTACRLWKNYSVKTLPGSYLAVKSPITQTNPGENHIRIALVHDHIKIEELCQRLARELLS